MVLDNILWGRGVFCATKLPQNTLSEIKFLLRKVPEKMHLSHTLWIRRHQFGPSVHGQDVSQRGLLHTTGQCQSIGSQALAKTQGGRAEILAGLK